MARELSDNVGATRDTLGKLHAKVRGKYPAAEAEVLTGEKWIDGKEVRRKVLAVAAGPNASTVATAHGLGAGFVLIRMSGMLSNGTLRVPLPHVDNITGDPIEMSADATNVNLTDAATGADYSAYSGHVVLEYVL